jgi:hypothetical protein
VIVEAKTAKNLDHGEAQLLAYMGRSTTSYHTERIADVFIGLSGGGPLSSQGSL